MTLVTATVQSNALPDPINDFFASKQFPKALSDIINEYVMKRPNCFGGAEFRHFLGVYVGNPVLSYNAFVPWWDDFDALDVLEKVDKPRRNWQTHLDPIFRPQSIRDICLGKDQVYNLETLARYVAHPLNGHPMTICQDSEAFTQHARTLAGPGCWLVRRKDIVARNQTYKSGREFIARLNRETRAGYELENTLLDLATDAAVRYVFKGERHFGDSTGIEGRWTFVRSGDLTSIGNNSFSSALGGFSPFSGFRVHCYADYAAIDFLGVVALRQF